MAFVVADDKVEGFLKEKADKDKVKQIYKAAERFEQHHKPKPQTNADHIRSLSDEELAEFLEQFEVCTHCKYFYNNHCNFENPCVHEFAMAMAYEWLKSEVKE